MSHLICKHKRRVLVLPEVVVHRSDGTHCNGVIVSQNGNSLHADEVIQRGATKFDAYVADALSH